MLTRARVRIGLLGRGDGRRAPSTSCWLSAPRRSPRPPAGGRRSPACCGAAEGDFDRILEDSEIVVELIGGTEPARDYVLRGAASRDATW